MSYTEKEIADTASEKIETSPRTKLAIERLHDMIDGGEECSARDSQLSLIIGILEGDKNCLYSERNALARIVGNPKLPATNTTEEVMSEVKHTACPYCELVQKATKALQFLRAIEGTGFAKNVADDTGKSVADELYIALAKARGEA